MDDVKTETLVPWKPSWEDAPEWANWLAQDHNGHWYWYKKKPSFRASNGYWVNGGRACSAGLTEPPVPPIEERPNGT